MDQRDTPYADAMRAYATSHPTRFDLPGHGGTGDSLGDYFGASWHTWRHRGELYPFAQRVPLAPSVPICAECALNSGHIRRWLAHLAPQVRRCGGCGWWRGGARRLR